MSSRIGRRPIPIPEGVEVKLQAGVVTVKGPKGELKRRLHPDVQVDIQEKAVSLSVPDETKESKSLHGLFRVLISNMIQGVTKGFEKTLEIVGVGYKAEVNGRTAVLNLGYSHPINFELPEGVEAKAEKGRIILNSIDKEALGRAAADIRRLREPEPYKGKGVKYAEEIIRKKAGKGAK